MELIETEYMVRLTVPLVVHSAQQDPLLGYQDLSLQHQWLPNSGPFHHENSINTKVGENRKKKFTACLNTSTCS